MKRNFENTYCGLFDSRTKRGTAPRTEDRRVDCFEIEIFSEEVGVSHIDGKAYPVKRGMILCAKPGQIRYSELPIRCNFIRIQPGDETLDGILESLPNISYVEKNEDYESILGLMKKLGGCFVSGSKDDEDIQLLRINALLYETVYRIHREVRGGNQLASNDSQNRLIAEAYGYIDENFTSSCTLAEIAKCVHVSPNYLHTLFKSVTGQTPFEYVTQRRINKAKRLIMAGELTLLEVALTCGFCSQSHFNKVFREVTGQTPAVYRRTLADKYL